MVPDLWVEPSDASSPSLYLAATTWENQSKNHPAQPSEPTEPCEQILNCVLSHCSVGWFCYAAEANGNIGMGAKVDLWSPIPL